MSEPRVPRPLSAAVLTAVVLLAGCTATSPAATGGPSEGTAAASPSAAPPSVTPSASADAFAGRQLAAIELGGGPDFPTEGFGSLWILAVDGELMRDGTSPAVHRVDPETNEIVASIALPGRVCQGIGVSPEAVWACGPDGLVRIDPATNAIVAEVPLDAALVGSRLAYGAGSVWAFATTAIGADTVVRVDPATNAVTATIPLGHIAGTMAFGFDALWVSSPNDDVLLRIDPATDEVAEWTTGVDGAEVVIAGQDALWVSLLGIDGARADPGEATVARIDPASGDVTAEVAAGASLETSGGIAEGADALWVRGTDPFLAQIDPATAELVDRIDAELGTGDVVEAFGSVWIMNAEGGMVYRISP